MDAFTSFVLEHAHDDPARLLLSVKQWPAPEDPFLAGLDPGELAVRTIEARRKLEHKLPDWYARAELVYPTALCAEQCSSAVTASYKAALARSILADTPGGRIADLTGGLGADAVAFSGICSEVLYNERETSLAAAARHNFPILGAGNILVRQEELVPGGLLRLLDGFVPDLVFLDPARRSAEGRKVFLLEECSPDVLELLPELFGACRHVLLKLSPMADVTMMCERLSHAWESVSEENWNRRIVREIHVVAAGGECRELLLWLDRSFDGEPAICCVEDGGALRFSSREISAAKASLPDAPYGRLLFEPGKSLTKAGVTNALCARYPLVKLARFTHLYFADGLSAEQVAELSGMGKFFTVKDILPLSKASFRTVSRQYPRAEVSARNLPLSSDELRTRLGVSSGGDVHVFGVKMDLPHASENFLLVGERFLNL